MLKKPFFWTVTRILSLVTIFAMFEDSVNSFVHPSTHQFGGQLNRPSTVSFSSSVYNLLKQLFLSISANSGRIFALLLGQYSAILQKKFSLQHLRKENDCQQQAQEAIKNRAIYVILQ